MRAIVFLFLRTYRLPLIAVALAVVHSLVFWSYGPRVPLGLCIAAVMVSAWQGGMRSSLVATGLSVLVLGIIGHFQTPGPMDDLILRLGLFVLVGLIAGYLSQQCRYAIHAVDHVHQILGGSGIAIIATDAEGHIASLNPLARTLSGVGEADLHGRPLDQVFRVIHGTTRQPLPLPAAGTPQDLPEGALLVGHNGSETKVEGTIAPFSADTGKPAGVMVVFREANGRSPAWEELTQRAERFRALAGHAPSGLMLLDAEGRCVFSNPAVQSACGCTDEECLGEGWSRHVQAQDRDHLISEWLKAVVGKQPFAAEFRVVGEAMSRWLRVRSSPMLGDNGEVLGHVAALEDVTERKRAEEALADARRESEEHLQEWSAAEKKAQDALRQTEDALRAARTEAEQKLRAETSRRQQTEKELHDLREQMESLRDGHQRLQSTLKEKDRSAESLRNELVRHQREAVEAREALDRHQTVLAQKGGAEEALRSELARHQREAAEARHALDQHRAALAEKGGAEETLRQEMDRLAADAAALRQSHDRLQALLAQKDGNEGSLRQELERLAQEAEEARQVHDRLQTTLAEQGKTEEALRKELERLQGEAEARRQAEEVHERLRSLLGDKEQREEALRREKEFLEGVIDGSPAGIFAHDGEGRCRVWNAALERLLGRSRTDALGRTAGELFPPSDKPRVPTVPPTNGGADRLGSLTGGVIGRSEMLESVPAAVHGSTGEVIGGMTLVRVLPMPAPREETDELPALETRSNGHETRTAARVGDRNWLDFN